MDPQHLKILKEIKAYAPAKVVMWVNKSYHRNDHKYYGLKVPQKRKIARSWAKENKEIDYYKFIDTVDSLTEGKSFDEKTIAAEIVHAFPAFRSQIIPRYLDTWLARFQGWAEVDALCYGFIKSKDLFVSWRLWEGWIRRFSKHFERQKRRASIVLLIKPVTQVKDDRLKKLAFEVIERLKIEKEDIITKALSWLLRSMVANYRDDVADYLEKNKDSLPPVAVRETERKLHY